MHSVSPRSGLRFWVPVAYVIASAAMVFSLGVPTSKDLVIAPVGDKLRTSFAYNVEIPIIEPVFLLVKYEGSATSAAN